MRIKTMCARNELGLLVLLSTLAWAAPSTPTGLTATNGTDKVSLTWIANASSVTGYNLYRSNSLSGVFQKINPSVIQGTSWTDGGLTNDILLYYKISAVDSSGESALSAAVQGTPMFVETFDNNPVAPEAINQGMKLAHWDVMVHSRGHPSFETPFDIEPMASHHGTSCEPFPATHTTSNRNEAVYSCRNHLMTSIHDGGYGAIYLTPDRLVDFTNGEAVIRFDLSTLQTVNARDWPDVWITPFDENLHMPLQPWLPDGHGYPKNAVTFTVKGGDKWFAEVIRNFQSQIVRYDGVGWKSFLTPSAVRRDTVEIRISRTHLKIWMPNYPQSAGQWVDHDIPALPFTKAIVQFAQHSYNPDKDCGEVPGCGSNSWHWDNLAISPSIPFSIIKPEQLDMFFVDSANDVVRFTRPSPRNAYLRFSSKTGASMQVSWDRGQTWINAPRQQVAAEMDRNWDNQQGTYWVPMPEGVQEVRMKGSVTQYGGNPGWHVRHIAIFALDTPVDDSTPPAVPQGLQAAPGDSFVHLNWNANSDADLLGYNVYRREGSATAAAVKLNNSAVSSTNYMDSVVSNGTLYYYFLTAIDQSQNQSGSSSQVSATPQSQNQVPTPPVAPQMLQAIAGDANVRLSWMANNESDLKGYHVYQSLSATSGFTRVNPNTLSSPSYTAISLQNDQTYFFRVTAVDLQDSESTPSATVSATPRGVPTLLIDQPTNNQTIQSTSLNVQYRAMGDLSNVGHVAIQIDQNTPAVLPALSGSYPVSGLSQGWHTLRAYLATHGGEIISSGLVSFLFEIIDPLLSPAIPINLHAAAGDAQVVLQWDANTEGDLAGYRIYVAGAESGPYGLVSASLLTGTSYTHRSLQNNKLYFYKITAVDFSGNESAKSASVSALPQGVDQTPPAAPVQVVALATDRQMTLTWRANTEGDVAGYNVYRFDGDGHVHGGGTLINQGLIRNTFYMDLGLLNGILYEYEVTAVDHSNNESARSTRVSGTPNGDDLPRNTGKRAVIHQMDPSVVSENEGDRIVRLTGDLFEAGSVVYVNGLPAMTMVSATNELRFTLLASWTEFPGELAVDVRNPNAEKSTTIKIEIVKNPSVTLNLPKFLKLSGNIVATGEGSVFLWTLSRTAQGIQRSVQKSQALAGGHDHDGGTNPPEIAGATGASAVSGAPSLALPGYGLAPGLYEVMVKAQNRAGKVSAPATAQVELISDLVSVRVYPNPWRVDYHRGREITFDNMGLQATVKIYTLSGQHVKTLPKSDLLVTWNLKNESGDPVASGVYLYLIQNDQQAQTRGKFAVVR